MMITTMLLMAVLAEAPGEVRTEYREDPVGIDTTYPRLFWKLPKGAAVVDSYYRRALQQFLFG